MHDEDCEVEERKRELLDFHTKNSGTRLRQVTDSSLAFSVRTPEHTCSVQRMYAKLVVHLCLDTIIPCIYK